MPKGVYIKTEQHKQNLAESAKKRDLTGDNNPARMPGIGDKIRASLKGKPKSPEHCAALSAARMGKSMTPELRSIISKANKGKPKSPEQRAKISAAMKGKKNAKKHF